MGRMMQYSIPEDWVVESTRISAPSTNSPSIIQPTQMSDVNKFPNYKAIR